MRVRLDYDPFEQDYGPASDAIRSMLTTWARVDWFESLGDLPARPRSRSSDGGCRTRADVELQDSAAELRQHQVLAAAYAPGKFSAPAKIDLARGGWDEFIALCERARRDGFDWKYGPLKSLSQEHAKAKNWSVEVELDSLAHHAGGNLPRPGALFFRHANTTIWTTPSGVLDLPNLPKPAREAASWYHGYAVMDLTFAIHWQLAERGNDTSTNPFLALVRCYEDRVYPFGIAPDAFVAFRFADDAS